MSKMTIELDEETKSMVDDAASSEGVSTDEWVCTIIKEKLKKTWPKHILDMAGTWGSEFPDASELRQGQGSDIPREPF